MKCIKKLIFKYKDTISILDAERLMSNELEYLKEINFKVYITIKKYYLRKLNTIRFAYNELKFKHFVKKCRKNTLYQIEKNYIKAIKWIKHHPTKEKKQFI